jgi:chromosome segregation ATPase
LEFREKERQLRQQDLKIQETIIQFSVYLQDNKKKREKAQDKITQEQALKFQKEEELEAKQKLFQLLEKKAQRIEQKKKALSVFEEYLDRVKRESDEFEEIGDILSRYKTLLHENQKLNVDNAHLEAALEAKKKDVQLYEKEKRQEILQLNNDIAVKKAELEAILDQQNELKAEAEEVSAKKRGRITEFSQVLMAIDNIEQKCLERCQAKDKTGFKSGIRHPVNGVVPRDLFNSFDQRSAYAKQQLKAIYNYLRDFKEMSQNLLGQQDKNQMVATLKDRGEFI